jgi:hypothetical protein
MIASTVRATYIPNIFQSVEFWRKPTMDAEELLVHDRSEGQCTERVHAGIIQAFGVLPFTYTRQRSEGSYWAKTW